MILAVLYRLFGEGKGSLESVPDEELMLRFGEGDRAAFGELVRRHEGPIYRYILRSVNNQARAEELVQDLFLRVCKAAKRYSSSAKFTTWLYTIARNLCIDNARKSSKRNHLSLDHKEEDGKSLLERTADVGEQTASSWVLRKEFRAHLEEALETLPEEQREVFLMRQVGGLKFREIAVIMEVSENTIKSRMRYALESLRGQLAAYKGFSFDADDAADAHFAK